MPVRAVLNVALSPHDPSVFCFVLSQRRARITVASPPPAPHLPRARPRWPGLRLAMMPGITIGDFTFATVVISAGLAETGSLEKSAGCSTGVMSPTGPSTSLSWGSSMSGGSGGSSGGSSSGMSSGGSMTSTAAVTGGGISRRGRSNRMMTVISGTAIATAGPERRCSWRRANLYSPESFGIFRPAIMRRQRSRNESSSKSFCISRYARSLSSISSSVWTSSTGCSGSSLMVDACLVSERGTVRTRSGFAAFRERIIRKRPDGVKRLASRARLC